MLNESYYNFRNELYCNLLSKKLGVPGTPATPMHIQYNRKFQSTFWIIRCMIPLIIVKLIIKYQYFSKVYKQ